MKHLTILTISLVLSLLCLFPSLYNGFPLVFSDTGTYIHSGFTLTVPADRPINYGIFVFITSLGHFPLLTVFVQLFVSFYFYFKVVRLYFDSLLVFFVCLISLLFFTPQIYFCNLLITDFAFLPLFCALILIFKNENSRIKFFYYAVAVFLASFHLGFLFPFLFILFILGILSCINNNYLYYFKIISIITLSSFGLLLFQNIVLKSKFTINEKGYLFFSAKLIDIGLFQQSLNDNCIKGEKYKLCKLKDSFDISGSDFLWQNTSPLYQFGGWDSLETEYKDINFKSFCNINRFQIFLQSGINLSLFQILNTEFGNEVIEYKINSAPFYSIREFYPNYLSSYLNSHQQNDGLLTVNFKKIFSTILFGFQIFIFSIFIFLILSKNILQEFKILLLYYLISLLFLSFFTIPDSRYIIRMESFYLLILIINLFVRIKKSKLIT